MLKDAEGAIITMRMVRKTMEEIGLNSKEYKEAEIKESLDDKGNRTGALTWKPDYPDKDIEIPEPVIEILKNSFNKLDKAGKINFNLLGVIEKLFPEIIEKEDVKEEK